ncbi:MAG: YhcH/YjgK/YiaL family protein [Clostridia bacterium]|nr:YhcH/YjgK/YiaL family protein [Clostridia bacterium]
MIFDTLSHIENYRGIHEGVFKGLLLLRDTDFSVLEDKRYELEGEDFFFITSYETQEANDAPEAHQKYIDIQCLISGTEKMNVGALEEMTDEVMEKRGADIRFYHGPTDTVTLVPGKFAVLFPGDAHAPNIACGAPAHCRKVVVKVKV